MKKCSLALMILCSTKLSIAYVQPTSVTSINDKTQSGYRNQTSAAIGLTHESFLYPELSSKYPGSHQILNFNFSQNLEREIIESKVKASAAMATRDIKTYNYLYLEEGYLASSLKLNQEFQMSLGRRTQDWSYFDQEWNLGLWQPRGLFNPTNPIQMGLTGLHTNVKMKFFEFIGFVSMVHLPDQGTSYEKNNGSLTSANPYFKAPETTANVFGKNTPVRYDVKDPNLSKIIFQPSVAASVKLGLVDGIQTRASYVNKVMAPVFVGVEQSLDLNGVANPVINAFTVRHEVAMVEQRIGSKNISAYLSGTREWAKSSEHHSTWITQQAANADFIGTGLETRLEPIHLQGVLGVSYMKRFGGDAEDLGDFASKNETFFQPIYAWKEAVQFKNKIRFTGYIGNRINWSNRFIYELKNRSSLYSTLISYDLSKHFQIGLGGELLSASPEVKSAGYASDFASRNRSNDRFYGGISYVF